MHMFFIYRALQVYTQIYLKKINRKNNTPSLPALKLSGIKVINGVWTPSHQAPDSLWPLWPGSLHLWGSCQPAAPSLQCAFLHPCFHQKGHGAPSAVKYACFRAALERAPLLICRQPVLLLDSVDMQLQAVAQRPNKCLPSSLMWYTAPVGSVGSLLEDKINFWVMHFGKNNLNEPCMLLGYKLTVTTEEKRCGHHPDQLSQTFSCSVTSWR